MSSERDQAWALRAARERAEQPRHNPAVCPRAPLGAGHMVDPLNPMATGRCTSCRAYVRYSPSSDSWLACTVADAARRGALGVRADHLLARHREQLRVRASQRPPWPRQ